MRRSPWRPADAAWPAVLALAVLTGCALTGCSASGSAKPAAASSTAPSPMPAATGHKCGTGKTAAGCPGAGGDRARAGGLRHGQDDRTGLRDRARVGPGPGQRGRRARLHQRLGVRGIRHPRDSPHRRRVEVLERAFRDPRRARDALGIRVRISLSLTAQPGPTGLSGRAGPEPVSIGLSLTGDGRPGSPATTACPRPPAPAARPGGTRSPVSGPAGPDRPPSRRSPCQSP